MNLMLAIPGGHMRVAQPPAWMVSAWYALLAIAALWLRARRTARPRTEDSELA